MHEKMQDIPFQLKPRRSLHEMADAAAASATNIPNIFSAFLFLDEATDPVTIKPMDYLNSKVVKPMFERCYGKLLPVHDYADCIIYSGPRADGMMERTSFGVVGNDNVIIHMSMYEKPPTQDKVDCMLRMRFMHLDSASGQTYKSEFQEKDIDDEWDTIDENERFIPSIEFDNNNSNRDAYISFAFLGGQFVLDRIKQSTACFLRSFLRNVCEAQKEYGPGCRHVFEMAALLLSETNKPIDPRQHAVILQLMAETMRSDLNIIFNEECREALESSGIWLEGEDDFDFDEGWNLAARQHGDYSAHVVFQRHFFHVSWTYTLGSSIWEEGMLEIEVHYINHNKKRHRTLC